MRTTTALVLCFALSAASCRTTTDVVVFDPAPGAARLRAGESVEQEVDRLVGPLVHAGRDRGIIVGVLHPGGAVETFRYSGSGESPAPRGNTLFQVGSVTKVLVAALLSVLFEEGTLKPGDTVREILPAEIELSPDAGDLTLQELATHASGLPREPIDVGTLFYAIDYMFTGHNFYRYLTRERAYECLRDLRLPPRAQRKVDYSNLATALLANLIEVRTGRSLPDLLAEKVTGPLGLHDTVFSPDVEQKRRLATGHVGDQPCYLPHEMTLAPWDLGDFMRGSGGLYSTLDDLMVLARVNLGLKPHPLAPLLREMQRPLTHNAVEAYGLGWIIQAFDGGRNQITYKYGIVSGYSSYLGMNVEKRLAVVVLSDSFHWDDRVGHNLLLRLSGSLEPAPAGVAAMAK